MTRTQEIAAIAAQVWDQDEHTKEDLRFLEDISLTDRWCSKELSQSNFVFGATSEAHQKTKAGISAVREAQYLDALNRYQGSDNVIEFQQAAE